VPKAKINDVNIYYEVYGSGEPLLLIMGLGASLLGWQSQIPTLSQHFRVIAFDNRGTGRSDRPDDCSIELFAEDTAGLLKALDIDSTHVFGVSMGGMIAQELALTYPEMVRSLVLGVTSPCLAAWPPTEETAEAALRASNMMPREAFEAALWMGYSDGYVAEHKEALWSRFQIELPLMAPPEYWQKQLDAVLRFDARDRVGGITAPTLVMTGANDPVIPPEGSRYLAEHIPDAELMIIPGARHGFNVEFEEQCNQKVIDFLKRQG